MVALKYVEQLFSNFRLSGQDKTSYGRLDVNLSLRPGDNRSVIVNIVLNVKQDHKHRDKVTQKSRSGLAVFFDHHGVCILIVSTLLTVLYHLYQNQSSVISRSTD